MQDPLAIEWIVDCEKDLPLHFFLAGNQRKLKLTDLVEPQAGDATEIELVINGQIHYAGSASQLREPCWETYTPSEAPARFKLIIRNASESKPGTLPPGFSVEYFWQPEALR